MHGCNKLLITTGGLLVYELAYRLAPHHAAGLSHDRRSFACGAESLDRYLREQASQDIPGAVPYS